MMPKTKKIRLRLITAAIFVLLGGIAVGVYSYRQVDDPENLCVSAKQMEIQGKFNDALDYYWYAEKKLKSKQNDIEKLASVYMKLGAIYFAINENNNAKICYENAGKIWKRSNSPNIIQVYSNLATIYIEEHQLMLARDYYLRALEETDKRKVFKLVGSHNIAMMYYYLADVYFELNTLTDAEVYFLKSLDVMNDIKATDNFSVLEEKTYWRLTALYFRRKNYSKSLTFGLKALTTRISHCHPSTFQK